MKTKLILSIVALLSMSIMLLTIPAKANGPVTGQLLIHVYFNPDVENADLMPVGGSSAILDINDWPLTSDWITKYAAIPGNITMRSYTENGMMEFDLNNQAWPTGYSGKNSGRPEDVAATYFRQAMAQLTNKPKIVSDILKGYGVALKVPLTPSLNQYVYQPTVDYVYSPSEANKTLYKGGFYYDGSYWWWWGDDGVKGTGDDAKLPTLKVYTRLDDPNRMTAGQYLVTELQNLGFGNQLSVKITERTVCYQYVMVLYDYNIYTGGWSLGADPDNLYDLYNSRYGMNGWGMPEVGWAPDYPGNWLQSYDDASAKVKFAANEADLLAACLDATKIFWDNEFIVSLWSASAVKAYKAGSTGTVNEDGYGLDNGFTFLRMAGAAATDGKIDYGFKSDIEGLQMITSQWLWDSLVLGEIYDGLIGRNPYQLSATTYYLATAYSVGTWDGGTKTMVTFTPRAGVTWQDGVAFTVDDIIFSWEFTKACGAGVAWNYALIADMNHTAIEGGNAVIYYNVKSMFAKWWSGGLPILPKHVWEAQFPDWNTTSFVPSTVRTYHPWENKLPGSPEVPGQPGEYLTEAIGTGPWIYPFGGWSSGQSIKLYANPNFYLTPGQVSTLCTNSFWEYKGDATSKESVPYDVGRISGSDVLLVTANYGYAYAGCDFNGNGYVDKDDFSLVTGNFGMFAG